MLASRSRSASVRGGASATPRTNRARDEHGPDIRSIDSAAPLVAAAATWSTAKAPVEHRAETRHAARTAAATRAARRRPKVIYLFYADGKTPCPRPTSTRAAGTPPKFDCTFGRRSLDCQRQIQAYLDRWYADFNVIFTLTRPTERQVLHRGRHLGRRRLVQRRRPRSPASRRSCATTSTAASRTRSSAAPDAKRRRSSSRRSRRTWWASSTSRHQRHHVPEHLLELRRVRESVAAGRRRPLHRQTQNSYQMMRIAWAPGPAAPSRRRSAASTTRPPPARRARHAQRTPAWATTSRCTSRPRTTATSPRSGPGRAAGAVRRRASRGPTSGTSPNISGNQTITVTATDGFGHTTVATLAIFAPSAGEATRSTRRRAAPAAPWRRGRSAPPGDAVARRCCCCSSGARAVPRRVGAWCQARWPTRWAAARPRFRRDLRGAAASTRAPAARGR